MEYQPLNFEALLGYLRKAIEVHLKQDCEIQAAKRWVTNHANLFDGQKITLLGDDLYSHQPMVEHALSHNFNFCI